MSPNRVPVAASLTAGGFSFAPYLDTARNLAESNNAHP